MKETVLSIIRRDIMVLVASIIGGAIVLFSLRDPVNFNYPLISILFLVGIAILIAIEISLEYSFGKRPN